MLAVAAGSHLGLAICPPCLAGLDVDLLFSRGERI